MSLSRRDFMKDLGALSAAAGVAAALPGIATAAPPQARAAAGPATPVGKRPRILLTGHRGYVGSRFVAAFHDRYDIVGYDLVDGDDILDQARLTARMAGCDVVVHEAAIPAPVEGRSYADYFHTNVQGTMSVAQAAVAAGVRRLVYASSTTIYGIEHGIPFAYPINEGQKFVSQYLPADRLHCRDIDLSYHTSKVMAEQIVAWHGLNRKLQTVALRYGPIDKVVVGTSVSSANVLQATRLAIDSPREFWYEAFSVVDAVPHIDLAKSRAMLGYVPEPAALSQYQQISTFQHRLDQGA